MNSGAQPTQKKTILCVAGHFPPCGASGVFRTLGFVRYLAEHNWNVSVLTIKHIPEERIDSRLLDKVPSSVLVHRTGYLDIFSLKKRFTLQNSPKKKSSTTPSFDNSASLNKKNHGYKERLSFLLKTPDSYIGWLVPGIMRALRKKLRPDIIYATAPPFSALLLGVFLKKVWRRPLVIDLRDPWVFNPFRPQRPSLADRLDKMMEHFVIRNADHIILNTPESCRIYQQNYQEKTKSFSAIYNGFDSRFIKTEPATSPVSNKVWIVHVGSIYGNRNPIHLIKAIRDLNSIRIDLYGPGTKPEHMVNAENVLFFHPPVPHEKAISLQKGADIVLVLGNCISGSVQIPAKIFEILAIGKVIWLIDTTDSPTRKMLEEKNIPHLFCENKEKQIKKLISKLKDLKKNNELPLLENSITEIFDRKKQAQKLEMILKTSINSFRNQ